MTVEISPPTSASHSVHTNDSGSCTNYQSYWMNLKVRRVCRKKKANEMHHSRGSLCNTETALVPIQTK